MTADEQLRRAAGEIELLAARLEGVRRDAAKLRADATAIEAAIVRGLNAITKLRLDELGES